MAKNQISTQQQYFDEFSSLLEEQAQTEGLEMVGYMVQSSHNQMDIALGLTRLIVEKNTGHWEEAKVLATFKQALKMINENSPLKQMWEMVSKPQ